MPNLGFLWVWVFFKYPKISRNGNPLFFPVCAVCEKPVLEGEELPDDSPDNSVCCDNWALWFHFHCVQVSSIEEVQEWLCQACLEDLVTEDLNVIATD